MVFAIQTMFTAEELPWALVDTPENFLFMPQFINVSCIIYVHFANLK